MSNGFFSVVGTQSAGPNQGLQQLGPFNVDFSAVADLASVTVGTNATVPVPAGANGVWLINNPANTFSISYRTTSGDTGINMAPGGLAYISFDPDNYPTDIYLRSGASMVLSVQFV